MSYNWKCCSFYPNNFGASALSVDVERFEPFVLSYIATMFFGVQFESIDKRRLKVIELAEQG